MSRTHGRVKWFDEQQGIGIICDDEGRHVFVPHTAAVAAGFDNLKEGDIVEFDCDAGPCGLVATRLNVRSLPRHSNAAHHSTTAQPVVLIVEDDHDLNAALSRMLHIEGYGVQMASNVPEALDHIASHRPDAAIIDIHLPHENGLQLVEVLRARFGKSLPVIILSGDAELATLRQVAAVGVTHYLHKPVPALVLINCLSKLVLNSRNP